MDVGNTHYTNLELNFTFNDSVQQSKLLHHLANRDPRFNFHASASGWPSCNQGENSLLSSFAHF